MRIQGRIKLPNWWIVLSAFVLICSARNVAAQVPTSSSEATDSVTAHGPVVAGYIERAWLGGTTFSIKAKLDTGAKSSSLNVGEAVEFKKNAQAWIRLSVRNETGDEFVIERPVERLARIRRAGAKISERPVIRLMLCVAGKSAEVDVTLADRKGMNYNLLIGRSFLRSRILVDSSATFLNTAKCE